MRISYLIPTKNRAGVLKEALESLLLQTVSDWEAIIIDDGGDDATEEMVEEFNDKRFKYFKLKESHGPAYARNLAATMANSSLIGILDSDDICYPSRTEITLKAFEENPGADIFYAHVDIYEEESGLIRDRKTPFVEFSAEKLKEGNFIPHPTVAMKKQVLFDNPYNPFFRFSEDYELYTRLLENNKVFICTSEKVLKYRIHTDNMSIGDGKEVLVSAYGKLSRMIRGWLPWDNDVLNIILESKK